MWVEDFRVSVNAKSKTLLFVIAFLPMLMLAALNVAGEWSETNKTQCSLVFFNNPAGLNDHFDKAQDASDRSICFFLFSFFEASDETENDLSLKQSFSSSNAEGIQCPLLGERMADITSDQQASESRSRVLTHPERYLVFRQFRI